MPVDLKVCESAYCTFSCRATHWPFMHPCSQNDMKILKLTLYLKLIHVAVHLYSAQRWCLSSAFVYFGEIQIPLSGGLKNTSFSSIKIRVFFYLSKARWHREQWGTLWCSSPLWLLTVCSQISHVSKSSLHWAHPAFWSCIWSTWIIKLLARLTGVTFVVMSRGGFEAALSDSSYWSETDRRWNWIQHRPGIPSLPVPASHSLF